MMMKTLIDLAWTWFGKNIKLPFNKEKLKEQSLDIAYNQGLPALVQSLEQMVPEDMKQNLNHGMWQAVKQAANSNNPGEFVKQAATALQNSGQVDEIMKHIKA